MTSLPAALSGPRLKRYLDRYDGRADLAIRMYAWNIEISSAFWGPLSILEICLRNALHDALKSGRNDAWWYTPHVRLAEREAGALKSSMDKLFRAGNTDPSADDVVGATSFGFWTGLVGPGIARHHLYDYETALWQPRLQRVFGSRGAVGRKQIHAELTDIRLFRNRIAHH